MKIRDAHSKDLVAIVEIYNNAILTGVAAWNETPTTLEERVRWLAAQRQAENPVLVATGGPSGAEEVWGFATYSQWRPFEAYRHTVEDSIYVRDDHHGKGVGKTLLSELIQRARTKQKHVMIAGVGTDNSASIGLHESLGFVRAGTFPQVGTKFGRWLDLIFLQLDL